MFTLFFIEIEKIIRKPRSFLSIIAVILLVGIIMTGMGLARSGTQRFIESSIGESFYYQGNILNGNFIAYMILNTLWIHIPILITIVTGDLIAGEANAGTFRILLVRPVSRIKIITAKFLAGIAYSTFIVLLMALLSLGVGTIIFGSDDLVIFNKIISIIEADNVIWRFCYAYLFAILSMSVVVALSFFFSSLANNSLGPIIGTMVVLILFNIITTLDLSLFNLIKPYLFTTYMNKWMFFFDYEINFSMIYKSILILFGHIVLFFGTTAYLFKRKNILT